MKLSTLFDSQYSFRDVQDMADKFNKYGLAAKHIGGKFYSYKNGKETGGPFDTMDQLAKHQEELLANESAEATIKPYISMYKGDDGKQVYDVLDKHSKSAFKTNDYDKAKEYFKNNFDKLKEAGGYEGQSEPTSHTFKDVDIRKIADTIKQKNIKAYPEQTDDGVKVHTFNQDRESVAQELEIEEAAPAVIGTVARALTSPGLKGTLSRAALNKAVSSMTSEDQPEPSLNDLVKQDAESRDDDEDIDQLPAFLKKAKEKENKLDRMRKLAGMSTASTTDTNEDYSKMTHEIITKLVKQGKTDEEIQQATGEAGKRIEIIRNNLDKENTDEATQDLAKTITPFKGAVNTNASPQMTAKGIDAITQGERPSPQQIKAVQPYMSKIAQAMQDPQTKTQMRNIIKKVQ